jgi:Flp pilus assembly protein TadD
VSSGRFVPRYGAMTHERKVQSEITEDGNTRRNVLARFGISNVCLALLFLLEFAIYWPAVRGQFVWDDQLLVAKNPLVTGKANLGTIWFQTDFSLTSVALWLQWMLWGNNPTGYHVVNIFLHATNCALLWRLLRRMKIPGAFLAALIFVVHPLCAASAAWISEAKNTLSLLFFLLSFWCFLKKDDAENSESVESDSTAEHSSAKELETQKNIGQGNSKREVFYFLSPGAFVLALLSKTSTIMLPVVLLLHAWWKHRRVTRHDLVRTAPFFLVALLFGCATIFFQARVMATHDPVQTENFFGRFAAAGKVIQFYIGRIFFPLNLSMIYPRWKINPSDALSYLPALCWLAMLALCWWYRRLKWPCAIFFALSCFTVLLFPVLGFLSMDYFAISRVSDHFLYLPMIPFIALAAAGLSKLPARFVNPIAAALVLALSFLTFQRAEIISTNESLWRDTLSKNPSSFTARNNLGCILAAQNELNDAIEQFKAAIELNPKNAPAHCNLARAYAIQRDFTDAEQEFQTALKLKSNDADIQQSYASALAQQGKFEEAIQHLRAAVKLEPANEMRLHLAALLRQTRNLREAVQEYRAVLARDPDSVEALNNLAWILATSRDDTVRNGTDAVRFAERACNLTARKNPMMLGTLAAAYAEAGRFSDAVTTATQAANLAESSGNSQFAAMNRQLISLYRAGRAFRE